MDAPADLRMDAAMEFDMGGDFLLDNELGRAASETSLVADLTHKSGKKVLAHYFFDFLLP